MSQSFTKSPILTLTHAKATREMQTDNLTPRQMAARTGIDLKRLTALESVNPHVACEPWAGEAVSIALVLGVNVRTLLGVTSLRELDLGFDPRDDLDVWRTGTRLPLSVSCRLCLRFGLADPLEIEFPPAGLLRQLWATIASGERRGGLGACPWCAQLDGDHLETCIPEFLWGVRNQPVAALGPVPRPRVPGRRRGASSPGKGLAALRQSRGTTQAVFADSIGISAGAYARLEQTSAPLNIDLAERIAQVYRVDVATLY